MKNSKKGFTLVELVVVIAILAILAAIAIPVVSNTINSSKVSGAASDAQTIELALKEADAQIEAGDTSVYASDATVSDVYSQKGIAANLLPGGDKATVKVAGQDYVLSWSENANKCLYVGDDGDIQGNELPAEDFAALENVAVVTLFGSNAD
ncbi:MAG: prepilin-type N-terminal cleavage/methylation domain-containing protein [Ruminococcus sp.]|nr:prepilin-type N-terminal cleavage/methylation domain-containing protein [Ruminococcus sp.]